MAKRSVSQIEWPKAIKKQAREWRECSRITCGQFFLIRAYSRDSRILRQTLAMQAKHR
ncbi:hypothetical protein PLANPX_5780 [Lacipirellula parvula]|uniref:Uncharacterized protein n=1 Tax=Lacipirellula parvula TaxID=2650471 RepID=A0A5K7XI96_9BACT|nr:hypothetical protein PLANPX_5780 [Lacipirellula parvula]